MKLSDKRVEILVLQDTNVKVLANNNDLELFVGNNTLIIKNWDKEDHRISTLKFKNENSQVRSLERFNLSRISDIQSLIDKAAIGNVADQQLERLDIEVVNGLKYLLASTGMVNNVNVYNCLGFDSREDQQRFVAAYATLYNKDRLQEIVQGDQVVEALAWLIVKGYSDLSSKEPERRKYLLLRDLDQCFNVMIDKKIVIRVVNHLEGSDIASKVERFIRHHQVELKERISEKLEGQVNKRSRHATNVDKSEEVTNGATRPSSSPLETQGYALNIIEKFEKVLSETAIKSDISAINLNFNPVKTQLAIVGQIISEKFSKISKTLYSFAKEACPEFQQTDKFLVHLRSQLKGEKETALLQQKVEKPSKILDQQVSGKVELSNKPDTFLNGTSVVKGISSVLER